MGLEEGPQGSQSGTDFLLQGEITERDPFELQTFEAVRALGN
jgi:hypothetical protein